MNKNKKTEEWNTKDCWTCGKKFIIKVDLKTRKILSNCFHSYLSKYHFMGWHYTLQIGKHSIDDFEVGFKNTFWKVVAYTKFQRWIIYGIWKLFFGWQKLEYWECDKCVNDSDDKEVKK